MDAIGDQISSKKFLDEEDSIILLDNSFNNNDQNFIVECRKGMFLTFWIILRLIYLRLQRS
jgi:hypothetical protein